MTDREPGSVGSSFEAFLRAEGRLEEANAAAMAKLYQAGLASGAAKPLDSDFPARIAREGRARQRCTDITAETFDPDAY